MCVLPGCRVEGGWFWRAGWLTSGMDLCRSIWCLADAFRRFSRGHGVKQEAASGPLWTFSFVSRGSVTASSWMTNTSSPSLAHVLRPQFCLEADETTAQQMWLSVKALCVMWGAAGPLSQLHWRCSDPSAAAAAGVAAWCDYSSAADCPGETERCVGSSVLCDVLRMLLWCQDGRLICRRTQSAWWVFPFYATLYFNSAPSQREIFSFLLHYIYLTVEDWLPVPPGRFTTTLVFPRCIFVAWRNEIITLGSLASHNHKGTLI